MQALLRNRMMAFGIDYLLILSHALLLLAVTISIGIGSLSPIEGQLIGFLCLTLPVFLYFYLMENGKRAATFGKKLLHIKVISSVENKPQNALLRNILKFLPWELAHFGVHWLMYFIRIEKEVPIWVWIALIVPQVAVLAYIISIFIYKGKSSLYDKAANTSVVYKQVSSKN